MDLRDSFKGLEFREEEHLYFVQKIKFISATTWLKQFYRPFDSDYWSLRKSIEEKITQAEILKLWEDKRDKAAALGTEVHRMIEMDLLGREVLSSDPNAIHRYTKWKHDFEYDKNLVNYPELRVFNESWGIAGTVDLVIENKNGILDIFDWKCTRQFRTSGGYSMMHTPFTAITENELTKYSLQMSLYRLMLERAGHQCSLPVLVWVPEFGSIELFPSIDFRSELIDILFRGFGS